MAKFVSCMTPRKLSSRSKTDAHVDPTDDSALQPKEEDKRVSSKITKSNCRSSYAKRVSLNSQDETKLKETKLKETKLNEPQLKSPGSFMSDKRVRRETLKKYKEVLAVNNGRRRADTMDKGFRARMKKQVGQQNPKKEEVEQRVNLAYEFRDKFFQNKARPDMRGLLSKGKNQHLFVRANQFISQSDARKSKGSRRTSVQSVGSRKSKSRGRAQSEIRPDLMDVPEEEDKDYMIAIDNVLQESFREFQVIDDAEDTEARINEVKTLRSNLLNEQTNLISQVKHDSKRVIKGLRHHIQVLKQSLKEEMSKQDDIDPDISEMEAAKFAFSSTFNPATAGSDSYDTIFQRERNTTEKANEILQKNFEKRLDKLQEELATASYHLNELELEQYYPKCMQWKVRVNSGDGLFIGIRDADLASLDCDFRLLGQGNVKGKQVVTLRMSNIDCRVGLYQFSIDGTTAKAKLLRGLFTPTVNRLDLELGGTWDIELTYIDRKSSSDNHSKWHVSKNNFNLNLKKQASGAGMLRLPDKIISWLVTSLLPSVMSSSLQDAIPVRFGKFLQDPDNVASVEGKVQIRGDVPPQVWCAPLVGPAMYSEHARRLIGLGFEEAVLLDIMCRSAMSKNAGFHGKSVSIHRLFKWRLQFASQSTSKLRKILRIIETDPTLARQFSEEHEGEVNTPEGWLLQLIDRVCELSVKPISFHLEIHTLNVSADMRHLLDFLAGTYIESLEHEVEKIGGSRAAKVAEKRLIAAQKRLDDAQASLKTLIPVVRNTISCNFGFMVLGGVRAGVMATLIENLNADLKLPPNFSLHKHMGEALLISQGYNLSVQGEQNGSVYTLKARHKWLHERDSLFPVDDVPEDDAQLTMQDVSLNVFPSNSELGTVSLKAGTLQGSLLLPTLAEMTMDYYPYFPDQVAQAKGKPTENPRKSRKEKKSVRYAAFAAGGSSSGSVVVDSSRKMVSDLWRRYKDISGAAKEQEPGTDFRRDILQGDHTLLPKVLCDDSSDLHIDVRGLKVQVVREKSSYDGGETIRLSINSTSSKDACAVLHRRLDLTHLFDTTEE